MFMMVLMILTKWKKKIRRTVKTGGFKKRRVKKELLHLNMLKIKLKFQMLILIGWKSSCNWFFFFKPNF